MIIVTGANGTLGRAVAERLLKLLPAEQVGVSVREPDKARVLHERGVRVRRGDFGDPDSLAHAFEEASQVLVISANAFGETAVRLNRTAIGAAKAAGARRVLYTSHMGSNPVSPFPPMRTHAATEAALAELGVPSRRCATAFTPPRRSHNWAAPCRPASWPCRQTGRSLGRRTPTWPTWRRSP